MERTVAGERRARPAGHQDALGAQPAVDDAAAIRVLEHLGKIAEQRDRIDAIERAGRQQILDRRAFDELLREPRLAFVQAGFVDADHARVMERVEDARLAQHVDDARLVRLAVDDLDDRPARQHEVHGPVLGGGRARRYLELDAVISDPVPSVQPVRNPHS